MQPQLHYYLLVGRRLIYIPALSCVWVKRCLAPILVWREHSDADNYPKNTNHMEDKTPLQAEEGRQKFFAPQHNANVWLWPVSHTQGPLNWKHHKQLCGAHTDLVGIQLSAYLALCKH